MSRDAELGGAVLGAASFKVMRRGAELGRVAPRNVIAHEFAEAVPLKVVSRCTELVGPMPLNVVLQGAECVEVVRLNVVSRGAERVEVVLVKGESQIAGLGGAVLRPALLNVA